MRQQIRFCTTQDGVRLAYATSGSGPPLVKVANWLSHLEFDWQSPVWAHWLAELSRYNTLVRYDERGVGLSDWNVDEFSVDAWVHDLETVVDALGLERFPMLALSQGGAVAVTYAVRHPERVSHLILMGAYARGRRHRNNTPQQRHIADALMHSIKAGWSQNNPAFRQSFTYQFIPGASAVQMQWFSDLMRVSASAENALKIEHTFHTIDVRDAAPLVRAPTLVLHPDQDAAVPFEEGRLLAGLIPGARFVPLQSQNHVLLADEPAWQHFLAEVRDFLGAGSLLPSPFADLTSREVEVLVLIAQGLDNAEIAAHLVISPATVRNHITSIFSKLDVSSRAQAIVRARDAGLGHPST